MTIARHRPKTNLTAGINDLETSSKTIIYHALILLLNDIKCLIKKTVEHSTKNLMDDPDLTVRSHAHARREGLTRWMKVEAPLAWDSMDDSCGNFALLSLILCVDPNAQNPVLILSDRPVTYDGLAQLLFTFASKLNQRRPAPITKDGGFQYVLPIALQMITQMIPIGVNDISHWSRLLIAMMTSMRIHLLPWHKNTPNAYATDLNIWISLSAKKGRVAKAPITLQDRIQQGSVKLARENPHAPWDVPGRLDEMDELWAKHNLPACWNLGLASLSNRQPDAAYVAATYQYVLQHYDGANWRHHLALVVAICFSRVVPHICFKKDVPSANSLGLTAEIRNMEWVTAQSTSQRGTTVGLHFIVMMLTALIGFWDSQSPLAQYLIANNNVLGTHWTSKHGTCEQNIQFFDH
jgi:hypothetical protein